MPLLPVQSFVAYSTALGMTPQAAERSRLADLPQFFADRFGWQELAEEVAGVYRSLPPHERESAAVLGRNYGQAASLEYHSREYDLPRVLSGHNSYWLWGHGELTGGVLIVIGDTREQLLRRFDSVELATVKRCDYCMPFENEVPIWICRGMKSSPEQLWEEIKMFI